MSAGFIMVDLCHKYEEPQHESEHTHEDEGRKVGWFGHVKRRPQIAPALSVDYLRRRGRPKLSPQILEITKFIKEEQVPSGLHCTVIHPAYEDKRQKLEWGNFLRFLKEHKRAAFVKTENGEMYIIPPSQEEEYSHAMVQYMMPDCFTRNQCHVKSG
ncbi:hypothetical protein Tco_0909727 [Tanacetum coccineum]|uniref:Uncharacterized protein n=1 Tax=Tanacetum coccineum TaxID=301880 RepID=A0ABQ5CSR6_9ASTR